MATFAIDLDRPVDQLRSFCNVNATFDAKFNGRDESMRFFFANFVDNEISDGIFDWHTDVWRLVEATILAAFQRFLSQSIGLEML